MEKSEKSGSLATQGGEATTSVQPVNSQFPPTFNVYYQKKLFSATLHISEHADQPLYAIKLPGWRSGLVLHSGPSDKDAPLATASKGGKWGCHTRVTLPPLPGSSEDASGEAMHSHVSLKTATYQFAIEVGGGGEHARRENFEWRSSRSDEVKQLDKHSRGWKLVRLDACVEGCDAVPGEPPVAVSSDGGEVVAIWAPSSGLSMTKASKFQFLGAGLTGELGERWAIMAVITALRIWYMEFEATVAVISS